MTDAQIIAVSITVLAVLVGTLFNNARIGDLNSGLNKRIEDTKEVLRAEMKANAAEMNVRLNSIDMKLDALLKLIADVDARVTRLEMR